MKRLGADPISLPSERVEPASAHHGRTSLESLLAEVLSEMGWRRSAKVLSSALPEDVGIERLDDAAAVLALLELPVSVDPGLPRDWQDGLDGAVLAIAGDEAFAIVRVNGADRELSTNGATTARVRHILAHSKRVLYLRNLDGATAGSIIRQSLVRRVRRTVRHGLLLSLFVNVFAALVPLFSMAVFDRVLGARAPESLVPLIAGASVVVLCVLLLRLARSRLLAAQYARLSSLAGLAAEVRLLRMPLQALQKQSIERIDARIAHVRRIADFFASANIPAVFDAPFIFVSLVLIAFIGGVLAIVPIVYLALFVAVAFWLSRTSREVDPELARAATERTALLHELSSSATEIRESGLADAWLKRFADTSKLAARGAHAAAVRYGALQSIGSILGTGAALATLAVGVDLAIEGVISSGALVGTMMLTWRITGPAQGFFLGLARLRAARSALAGLDQTLNIPTLATPVVALEHTPRSAPSIDVNGVYFRYDSDSEPAAASLSFKVEPGSVTVVLGPNGSGKTTLLRLLAGVLTPQSGQVFLNGISTRQYDPDELALSTLILPAIAERRDAIASPGRSWNPRRITGQTIAAVMGERGAVGPSSRPDDPSLRDEVIDPVKPLVLLDDPMACADKSEQQDFIAFIHSSRGKATVFFSTHDTSLVGIADNAVVLNRGALMYFGPIEKTASPERPIEKASQR
ncbi:ABC transporter transmembrane domain-containing protein [Aquabacter cavernae]|uniref:ABC transporter transmembrane domain-containing protein n=1 Tax=Aquabacter cavernae TaxID=2496029 RepID=UPI000F8C3EC4|nr:ABC transporter transmembrane domain-containing protein [Aquabacter cavernae]